MGDGWMARVTMNIMWGSREQSSTAPLRFTALHPWSFCLHVAQPHYSFVPLSLIELTFKGTQPSAKNSHWEDAILIIDP